MKIGIVADDLTGACDSISLYASRAMRCAAVLPEMSALDAVLGEYAAVTISTETRDASSRDPDAIRSQIVRAVCALNAIGRPEILFKKIDSTLRGNLAIELSAICSEERDRIPIICPAFPALGRTVVDRTLIVKGDIRQIVHESFDPQICLYSNHLDLRGIRRGVDWVSRWLDKGVRKRAVFFDAETESDLTTVAEAVLLNPTRWLPVGSAGFMRAIAASCCSTRIADPRNSFALERFSSGPVLYICGSKSAVTRNQIVQVELTACCSRVPTVDKAIESIRSGSRIAIVASPDAEQDHDVVLENLLAGIEELLTAPSVSLVVTGGATAEALLRRITDFSHLDVLGEFEPGVVVTNIVFRTSGNRNALLPLVLKAGPFGDAKSLARIAGM